MVMASVSPSDSTELTVPLSAEEDMFALAVIEYGGNLSKAYKAVFGDSVTTPLARARALLAKSNIAARIADLTSSISLHSIISIESHLIQLAEIRDMAKLAGAFRAAITAEELRGKVAGYYIGKGDSPAPLNQPDHLNQLAERLMSLQRRVSNHEVIIDGQIQEVPQDGEGQQDSPNVQGSGFARNEPVSAAI